VPASHWIRSSARKIYGCYAWLTLLVVVVPVTLLLIVTPGIMRRRRIVRAGARLVCRLAGCPIEHTGWRIPPEFACIVVANHSSYLDGIVLTAALPPRFAFLIKQEMAKVPVAGFVLRQIASEFVDRRSPNDRHRMARRLVETAHRGWTLAVFPEGTFDEQPGLRRFHTGAFAASISGNLPILPIVIHGARAMMPSGVWLPRPGRLGIHVCEPILPSQYGSVEALNAATRRALLEHLDEPDLEPAQTNCVAVYEPAERAPAESPPPGRPLWRPPRERAAASQMQRFLDHVRDESGAGDYAGLHAWSVAERGRFWSRFWDFCAVTAAHKGAVDLVDGDKMPGARWFPDARLNFAENLLAGAPQSCAIVFRNERGERRELSRRDLRSAVAAAAAEFRSLGVKAGDRVAGVLPNCPETVIAMLATTSIGAVWSSCSPDFGARGILDRFGPIEPKILIGTNGYFYSGKRIETRDQLQDVAAAMPSLVRTFVVDCLGEGNDGNDDALRPFPAADSGTADEPAFERFPFAHPTYILHTSGTTGLPKAIVHGAGGTLLQHRKEHMLHCDIGTGTCVFYYTTCGWMMWHWLVSSLASGATIVLFDGNPMHPDPGQLWRLAEEERVVVFGTSAKYLSALEKSGYRPGDRHDLGALKTILSTGSPLSVSSFEYVYSAIAGDLQLSSISGGTDIVSCFILGNPLLPVYAGEIQCAGLGMRVDVFDEDGRAVVQRQGELVCTAPFPSMPVGFWNDPDGSRYRAAYFERFDNVWCHGDYVEATEHGGYIMHGRSDTVLNPGGVRIGTAEIYRVVEAIPEIAECIAIGQSWEDDTRIVLFVRMQPGALLDDAARERIRSMLRTQASPRHVPAHILEVADIPRTRSGKIVELAVRDVVNGRAVANTEAIANPEALELFRDLPELRV
jgi:acetoacetyl-CoA synthetase